MKGKGHTKQGKKFSQPACAALILGLCIMSLCVSGCGRKLEKGEKVKTDYVICEEQHIPDELKKIIKEKEKKPGTFLYKNSTYLYVVICYGTKPCSGFSIQVEECCHTKETLYVRTRLVGPSPAEPSLETETRPRIVLRCPRMDVLCIIDS